MGYSKKQSVTLQTLADRLGVSRTTVSNAFNKPDQLTAELRERILTIARELGYGGPDPMAKSLRSGKSGAFGLILSGSLAYIMADPAAQQLVLGIAEVFDESADSLWILPSTLDRSSDVRRATEAVVDGFIIHCLPDDDPRIGPILARNLPIVSMHGPLIPGIPFVGSEDRIGAMTVANHICELGHRRIGVISLHLKDDGWNGPITEDRLGQSTNLTARERVEGMRTVLQEHGLDWSQVLSHECADFGFEAGLVAAGRLLDRAERPTAIMCLSDQLAMGAIQAAQTRGLRVPQDVSITGFDDISEAARSDPPLTTVRQQLRLAGAKVARLALNGWEGDPPIIRLPTELIVRASTAPAAIH